MKIEKTEYSYQVTECDLKFGEQITLDGEVLIPASVLGKIKAEIEKQKELRCFDDDDMTEDDIADIIEQSGLIVRGCMWKATWNVEDYDKGYAPIYSD